MERLFLGITLVLTIVFFAVGMACWSSRPVDEGERKLWRSQFISRLWRWTTIALVTCVFCTKFFAWRARASRLEMLSVICNDRIDCVSIQTESVNIELNSEDASQFMSLLLSGENVDAHHSSPKRTVQIEISGETAYCYSLGMDVALDEYWLDDVSCPECTGSGKPVRQFISPNLTEFLKSHGLE